MKSNLKLLVLCLICLIGSAIICWIVNTRSGSNNKESKFFNNPSLWYTKEGYVKYSSSSPSGYNQYMAGLVFKYDEAKKAHEHQSMNVKRNCGKELNQSARSMGLSHNDFILANHLDEIAMDRAWPRGKPNDDKIMRDVLHQRIKFREEETIKAERISTKCAVGKAQVAQGIRDKYEPPWF